MCRPTDYPPYEDTPPKILRLLFEPDDWGWHWRIEYADGTSRDCGIFDTFAEAVEDAVIMLNIKVEKK